MANLRMAPSCWRNPWFALLLGLAIAAPALVVHAATYGSDTYGGGPFNTGVDPAPVAPTPPSSADGVVIGGPLGIGYVNTNSTAPVILVATTPVTTSTVAASSTLPTASSAGAAATFTRALRLGDVGADVQRLQVYLNGHGFPLAASGPGSPEHETNRFGALTYRALLRFQTANAAPILLPLGLSRATGVLGASTIAFIERQAQ